MYRTHLTCIQRLQAATVHKKMKIMLGNFTFMLFKHSCLWKKEFEFKRKQRKQFFYGQNIAICQIQRLMRLGPKYLQFQPDHQI